MHRTACTVAVLIPLLLSSSALALEPDEAREISSIRHRCFLECVWADEHCQSWESGDCTDKREACTKTCTAEEPLAQARAWEAPADWGQTKEQAIEVCLPQGERAFLADLRCADGSTPTFERSGSVGSRNPIPAGAGFDLSMMDPTVPVPEGQPDTHTVDLYVVQCPDGDHELYLDMYHCGTPKPWVAPAGFTRPPRDE